MFSDPQSVTYGGATKSLPAISRSDDSSTYALNDAGTQYTLRLSHQFKARNRVVARLQRDAYASDPLVPAQNILAGATATLTLDFPKIGMTASDATALAKALVTWLSDTNLAKLAGGET